MYLIYVDEAGNTGRRKDPDQPIHMLGAIIVEESIVESVGDDVDQLSKFHFPNLYCKEGFELHGKDIFGGSGDFKGIDPAVRIQACRDIVEVLHRFDVELMWTAIDKLKCYANDHPHSLAFKLLLERLEPYLARKDARGLIIADENQEMEQDLIDDLVRSKRSSTSFGYKPTKITRIIDSVHFVQSKNNKIIQFIDVIIYFINKAKRIETRLIEDFMAATRTMSFATYKATNTKPAEKVVIELANRAVIKIVASKMFP